MCLQKDEAMTISLNTQKLLWSRAAGRCAFPECRRELVMSASETDDETLVGDTCQIVTRSPSGPRGDSPLTPEERDKYDNLILLCTVHHKLIDDQPNTYTVQVLLEMKAAHEEWVRKALQGYELERQVATASFFGDVEVEQQEDLCFVLMPFGDDMLQQVYEVHIKPTVERVGLQCKRADDVLGPTPIMEDIWKGIHGARVVLAELTEQNPNVFYELGLCHAIGKDAILMAQDIKWVPFDVRHRRTIIYTPTPRGCKQLEEVLCKTLEAVLGKAPAE